MHLSGVGEVCGFYIFSMMQLMLVLLLCRILRLHCVTSVLHTALSTSRGSNDDDGDDASGHGDRKRRPDSDASFSDLYNNTFDDCDDNLSLFLRNYRGEDREPCGSCGRVVPFKRRPLNVLRQQDVRLEVGMHRPDNVARGIDTSLAPMISHVDVSSPPLLQHFYPRSFSKAAGGPPQVPTNDGSLNHADVHRRLINAVYNMPSLTSCFVFCLHVVVSGLWLGKYR